MLLDILIYSAMGIVFVVVYMYNKLQLKKAAVKQQILNCLHKIQYQTGCNRVTLFEYRKGEKSKFISCRFEVTDKTTAPIMQEFKHADIRPYMDILNKINDSVLGWIRFIDEEDNDEMNRLNKYWGITTSYNFKITKSVWDGVVGLTWVNSQADLDPGQIMAVEIVIMGIPSLLKQA